jgi:peptidoglycan/xylan/chitin deacetylase (PgdA/CDA1 family)
MRIMQCWDDGDVDDIQLVDILKKHAAKATFNLNPGGLKSKRRLAHRFRGEYEVYRLTLDEMPQVYAGFCIGGHTMTHPDLPDIDPDWALAELVETKRYIAKHFGQTACGMAYPCGQYDDSIKALVKQAGYLYARTTNNVARELNVEDPMALHSHCHFLAADFWEKFEAVKAVDGDFYFWGHTFELMGDAARWQELDRQIGRLSDDSATTWVDVRDLFMTTPKAS